jgi:hypothetical protein
MVIRYACAPATRRIRRMVTRPILFIVLTEAG